MNERKRNENKKEKNTCKYDETRDILEQSHWWLTMKTTAKKKKKWLSLSIASSPTIPINEKRKKKTERRRTKNAI
jgi:hypothetical protein